MFLGLKKMHTLKSKTKQGMVFRMIRIKDSLLPMGKVWSWDSLIIHKDICFFQKQCGKMGYVWHMTCFFCQCWRPKHSNLTGVIIWHHPKRLALLQEKNSKNPIDLHQIWSPQLGSLRHPPRSNTSPSYRAELLRAQGSWEQDRSPDAKEMLFF